MLAACVACVFAACLLVGCAKPSKDSSTTGTGDNTTTTTSGATTEDKSANKPAQQLQTLPPKCNDKPRAAQRSQDAIILLANGDSAKAELAVNEALECDPKNELALNLRAQLREDPLDWARRVSGGATLTCPIPPRESLSRLAETYLGDKYSFWILARFNRIAVPSQVAAGQQVKIPTTRRSCIQSAQTSGTPPKENSENTQQLATDRKVEAAALVEEAKKSIAAAKYEDAMNKAQAALLKDPTSADAKAMLDLSKSKRMDVLIRQGRDARTRQRPAEEYRAWMEVLRVDAENRTALAELPGARQRLCNYDPKQCPQ
jgi:tetratricopeptide (TPR) repeat protein